MSTGAAIHGAPTALPEPLEAPAPARFCGACGHPSDPSATECPACTRRAAARAKLLKGEGRPLALALTLYFALLATMLGAWGADAVMETDPLRTLLWAQGIHSALVVLWGLVCWRLVAPALRGVRPAWVLGTVFMAGATFALAHGLVTGLQVLLHLKGENGDGTTAVFLERGWGWAGALLSTSLQPAIIEELAFRGVILGALLRLVRPRDAVIASALMFMVLHLSPLSFPHLAVMGAVLGWLRVRTGSLYPGMALHFVHNTLCLGLEYASGV